MAIIEGFKSLIPSNHSSMYLVAPTVVQTKRLLFIPKVKNIFSLLFKSYFDRYVKRV